MKNILLIEDDSFIIDIYANQLRQGGFKVEIATEGEMGLEKLRAHKPDLLILDIGLPKMSGWDVLKVIRGDELLKDLKVIVVSNNNQAEAQEYISTLLVQKYFLKIETTPEEILQAAKEAVK